MMPDGQSIKENLARGGIVVMPTDTIYGIVASALDRSAVEKIYQIRQRTPEKPCIILIGDVSELEKFSVSLSQEQKKALEKFWSLDFTRDFQPKPTSVILPCPEDRFSYLHRGTDTLAFRLPLDKDLQDLLKATGPLSAPSANIEGQPPAKNTTEAKKYFGNLVDLYVDGGEITGKPSKVIELRKDGSVNIIRK